MSARTAITGPDLPPLRIATTPVLAIPVCHLEAGGERVGHQLRGRDLLVAQLRVLMDGVPVGDHCRSDLRRLGVDPGPQVDGFSGRGQKPGGRQDEEGGEREALLSSRSIHGRALCRGWPMASRATILSQGSARVRAARLLRTPPAPTPALPATLCRRARRSTRVPPRSPASARAEALDPAPLQSGSRPAMPRTWNGCISASTSV